MGYTEKKDKFVEDDYTFLNGIIGAGGLYTSLNDYSKWLDALDKQTLLSSGSTEMMYRPARLNDGTIASVGQRTLKDIIFPDESRYSSYGYGWVVNKGNQSTLSHSGSWVGFRNNVYRNINTGLDVVIFSNRGDTLDRWIRDVMKIINKTILNY